MLPLMEDFLSLQEEVNFAILKILKDNNASFAMPTSTVYTKVNQSLITNSDSDRD